MLICLSFLLLPSFSFSQDTLCGIAWGPLIQLSPDSAIYATTPSIALTGDTVHVTWGGSRLRFPYVRSTDGGQTFEPMREIAPDSVGDVDGWCFLLSSEKRLHAFFEATRPGDSVDLSYHMFSDDRGTTWSVPYRFPDTNAFYQGVALGDTVAYISTRPSDWNYRITLSTNGGITWKTTRYSFAAAGMAIALTPGTIHLAKGYSFDSAGFFNEFVAQYRKSTDLGETWTDSIPLSTVNFTYIATPFICADGFGDSEKILAVWRDEKYGCLTATGCSSIGRMSTDNGNTFQPEVLFDNVPAADPPFAAIHKNIMAVAWSNNTYGSGSTLINVSIDGGRHWCTPFDVCDTSGNEAVAISDNAVHIVTKRVEIIDSLWHAKFPLIYRRGVLQPTGVKENPQKPNSFFLGQNYPDPFNPATKISYGVSKRSYVRLQIFNVLGQLVQTLVDGEMEPGNFTVPWDAGNVPSGVYFYRIVAGSFVETKKMVVIR